MEVTRGLLAKHAGCPNGLLANKTLQGGSYVCKASCTSLEPDAHRPEGHQQRLPWAKVVCFLSAGPLQLSQPGVCCPEGHTQPLP